jgi:hypothetical protein
MKKINKSLLYLGLFLSLSFVGCATASKPQLKAAPTVSPAELKCRSSCKLMAICSRRPYSDHDLLICGRECLAAHPVVRAAVTECSMKWLRNCNKEGMNSCVQKRLAPPKRQ